MANRATAPTNINSTRDILVAGFASASCFAPPF